MKAKHFEPALRPNHWGSVADPAVILCLNRVSFICLYLFICHEVSHHILEYLLQQKPYWVRIDYFTVLCLVAWLLNECEAGVDLVLIKTSLLLLCNFILSSMRSASLRAFLFPPLLGEETIQAQECWRNWRGVLSDGYRKWAVFLFNLSSHCCIYIVKYFFTRRDD